MFVLPKLISLSIKFFFFPISYFKIVLPSFSKLFREETKTIFCPSSHLSSFLVVGDVLFVSFYTFVSLVFLAAKFTFYFLIIFKIFVCLSAQDTLFFNDYLSPEPSPPPKKRPFFGGVCFFEISSSIFVRFA